MAINEGKPKVTESKKDIEESLEPGQYKPKNEGINNSDLPDIPEFKKARNNPTQQDEGLSGGGSDPLADL